MSAMQVGPATPRWQARTADSATGLLRYALEHPTRPDGKPTLAYALYELISVVGFDAWLGALDHLTYLLCRHAASELTSRPHSAKRRGL